MKRMFCIVLLCAGLNLALIGFVNGVVGDPDCTRWAKMDFEMSQVQIALCDWKTRHGRYPDSLAVLREEYFRGCLPRDRFHRRPLDYRTDGSRFTLTCFGKDGSPGGDVPPDKDIIYTERGRMTSGH